MSTHLTPEALAARDAGRAKIQGKILGGWQEFDAGFHTAAAHYTAETERLREALKALRKAGGALYVAASERENAGDFDVVPLGSCINWLKALDLYHAALAVPASTEEER